MLCPFCGAEMKILAFIVDFATARANTLFGQVVFFDGPVDVNGIPTQFIRSPIYGEAQSPSDYHPGREFLVSLGFRF